MRPPSPLLQRAGMITALMAEAICRKKMASEMFPPPLDWRPYPIESLDLEMASKGGENCEGRGGLRLPVAGVPGGRAAVG